MNNYEKIKSMSVEEMADWIYLRVAKCYNCPTEPKCRIEHQGVNKCTKQLIQWLNQEPN